MPSSEEELLSDLHPILSCGRCHNQTFYVVQTGDLECVTCGDLVAGVKIDINQDVVNENRPTH